MRVNLAFSPFTNYYFYIHNFSKGFSQSKHNFPLIYNYRRRNNSLSINFFIFITPPFIESAHLLRSGNAQSVFYCESSSKRTYMSHACMSECMSICWARRYECEVRSTKARIPSAIARVRSTEQSAFTCGGAPHSGA